MTSARRFAITPATKIRTNPYSRFGPATADRGSRGIRDQPRNPPKYTELILRMLPSDDLIRERSRYSKTARFGTVGKRGDLLRSFGKGESMTAHVPRLVAEHRSCRVRCADLHGKSWKSRCCEPRRDGPHSEPTGFHQSGPMSRARQTPPLRVHGSRTRP